MSEAITKAQPSAEFNGDWLLREVRFNAQGAVVDWRLARAAPSPQAPGRRKGPPGITLEPQGHEPPAVPVVSDEQIIRAAVSAMPSTNPLVAEDLIGGHTMHTEAEDIVAIWKAGVQWQALHTVTQPCGHPVSLVIRSAESGEALYCEACDDKSGRRDAEMREAELLEANQKLRDEILALRPQAVEPMTPLHLASVYAVIDSMGWDLDDQEKDDMVDLVRATEKRHGITAKAEGVKP